MRSYKTRENFYDQRLKLDAMDGNIPPEFEDVVTRELVYRWRKTKWKNFIGFDYYNKKEHDLRFMNREVGVLRKQLEKCKAFNEMLTLMTDILVKGKRDPLLLFDNREKIIECLDRNIRMFNQKQFRKLINVSDATITAWRKRVKAECNISKDLRCEKKRNPNQVSIQEEEKIVKLLTDPAYAHHSLTSLIFMARYENIVHADWYVWNRVRRQHKIQRRTTKYIKRKRWKGLESQYPNQYLHADLTYFRALSGVTYYIYIVKDNFSRYVKAWRVSKTISALVTLETFKTALHDINSDSELKTLFITDGGKEFTANIIRDFLKQRENTDIAIAGKDIHFSNQMVERFHNDLKNKLLVNEKIFGFNSLVEKVEVAIEEYNRTIRLQCLNGQTPWEAYNGLPCRKNEIAKLGELARDERRNSRKKLICCFPELDHKINKIPFQNTQQNFTAP
jgi:transposase InsO family protein